MGYFSYILKYPINVLIRNILMKMTNFLTILLKSFLYITFLLTNFKYKTFLKTNSSITLNINSFRLLK